MYKYYRESEVSRALYLLNKERLIWCYSPYEIIPCKNWEKILKYIIIFKCFIAQKIWHRRYYDNELPKKIVSYDIDKEIKYEEKIPKIVVYTCILGRYDKVYEPLYSPRNCEFYAITDFELPLESKWKRINFNQIIIPENLDVIRKARYIKTHPHLLFPEYNVSIWIDGNVWVIADVFPIVLKMKKAFLGVHTHPDRSRLDTELKAILAYGRIASKDDMKRQLIFYKQNGYDNNVKLLETTILVRKHNDKRCINIMECWWQEILDFSTRDQLSLPYVLWKNEITLEEIYIMGGNLRLNPRFRYMNHK